MLLLLLLLLLILLLLLLLLQLLLLLLCRYSLLRAFQEKQNAVCCDGLCSAMHRGHRGS